MIETPWEQYIRLELEDEERAAEQNRQAWAKHNASAKATCQYCHCPYLHWEKKENGKWQLRTPNGSWHLCKPYMKKKKP